MAYTMDCVRSAVPEAVEILTDAVLNPKFLPWEVAGAIARIREDVKNVKDNPYTVVNEARMVSRGLRLAMGPCTCLGEPLHAEQR